MPNRVEVSIAALYGETEDEVEQCQTGGSLGGGFVWFYHI